METASLLRKLIFLCGVSGFALGTMSCSRGKREALPGDANTAGKAESAAKPESAGKESNKASIYDFSLKRIDGTTESLASLRGRVLLIVNVASRCGYTPQYAGLQELYEEFGPRGLVVLGIPSNDFGGQEPGSNQEIRQFCTSQFKIDFPLYEKTVVHGKNAHPLYAFLESSAGPVSWNFNKYLIGKDGTILEHFESGVTPESEQLRGAVRSALQGLAR
ncbi:MAG: glutathione peroxidase [Polyangiaceae bacterium]|nr:glutathione peroxidase [Polyangiaceae bacterium]